MQYRIDQKPSRLLDARMTHHLHLLLLLYRSQHVNMCRAAKAALLVRGILRLLFRKHHVGAWPTGQGPDGNYILSCLWGVPWCRSNNASNINMHGLGYGAQRQARSESTIFMRPYDQSVVQSRQSRKHLTSFYAAEPLQIGHIAGPAGAAGFQPAHTKS